MHLKLGGRLGGQGGGLSREANGEVETGVRNDRNKVAGNLGRYFFDAEALCNLEEPNILIFNPRGGIQEWVSPS